MEGDSPLKGVREQRAKIVADLSEQATKAAYDAVEEIGQVLTEIENMKHKLGRLEERLGRLVDGLADGHGLALEGGPGWKAAAMANSCRQNSVIPASCYSAALPSGHARL